MLGGFGRDGRVAGGVQHALARGRLQLGLDVCGQDVALLEQCAPRCQVACVEALRVQPQANCALEVGLYDAHPSLAGRARKLCGMCVEHCLEDVLARRDECGRSIDVANRVDGGRERRQGGSRDHLAMDGESSAAGRRDELIDPIERLPTLLAPFHLLRCIQRDLPAVLDVSQKIVPQLPGGWREDRGAVEVSVDRVLQVIARQGQRLEVAVVGVEVIADHAIVGAQLLQDDARAIGQRLVPGAHAGHRLHRGTGRPCREHVRNHDHRRHSSESQHQPSTDAESR